MLPYVLKKIYIMRIFGSFQKKLYFFITFIVFIENCNFYYVKMKKVLKKKLYNFKF